MNRIPKLLRHVPRLDIRNAAGSVFMRRYKLLQTRWGNLYLHQILRSDDDKCLHDHPWPFATLILIGGYREQMCCGTFWRRPGQLLFRAATTAHRIEIDRPAWSLVIVGEKTRKWGFFTVNGWRAFEPGQPRPICEEAARVPGRWEVVLDDDGQMARVRWSLPRADGAYLWVRHYPGTAWGRHAAQREADQFNADQRLPGSFRTGLSYASDVPTEVVRS